VTSSSSTKQNLEQLEREARDLLHALQQRDPAAVQRYFSFDPSAGSFQPGLADARYIVARQHGFKSWQALKQSVPRSAEQSLSGLPWYFPA